MAERIQKLLATAGLGSRREVERWIRAGRVTVVGVIAQLGDKASPGDRIEVDGKTVTLGSSIGRRTRVLVYNKPAGELSTRHDPEGRPTVFETLPDAGDGRWIIVGRLDANSLGLLIFTDEIHTETGAHAKVLQTWGELCRERRLRGRPLAGRASRARLEQAAKGG